MTWWVWRLGVVGDRGIDWRFSANGSRSKEDAGRLPLMDALGVAPRVVLQQRPADRGGKPRLCGVCAVRGCAAREVALRPEVW